MATNPPSPTFSRSSTLVGIKSRTFVFKCIPSRVAVAVFSPALLLTSLAMVVTGSLLANKLEKHMSTLQRLAIGFQIFNYLFIVAAAVVGIHAALRMHHRASQLFTGLILGQLPFGLGSGILCIYVVFKVTHKALATSLAAVGAATQALNNATASGVPPAATSTLAATLAAAAAPTPTPAPGADLSATPPAPVDPAAATGAETQQLEARMDGANGQCPALDGTGLVWICQKTTLLKALIILTYLLLWFLEFGALYAGIMYNKQLAQARKLKGEDQEEDIYANA